MYRYKKFENPLAQKAWDKLYKATRMKNLTFEQFLSHCPETTYDKYFQKPYHYWNQTQEVKYPDYVDTKYKQWMWSKYVNSECYSPVLERKAREENKAIEIMENMTYICCYFTIPNQVFRGMPKTVQCPLCDSAFKKNKLIRWTNRNDNPVHKLRDILLEHFYKDIIGIIGGYICSVKGAYKGRREDLPYITFHLRALIKRFESDDNLDFRMMKTRPGIWCRVRDKNWKIHRLSMLYEGDSVWMLSTSIPHNLHKQLKVSSNRDLNLYVSTFKDIIYSFWTNLSLWD